MNSNVVEGDGQELIACCLFQERNRQSCQDGFKTKEKGGSSLGNALPQDIAGADNLWRLQDKFKEKKPLVKESMLRSHTWLSLS